MFGILAFRGLAVALHHILHAGMPVLLHHLPHHLAAAALAGGLMIARLGRALMAGVPLSRLMRRRGRRGGRGLPMLMSRVRRLGQAGRRKAQAEGGREDDLSKAVHGASPAFVDSPPSSLRRQ
jgi:hypothetical protein